MFQRDNVYVVIVIYSLLQIFETVTEFSVTLGCQHPSHVELIPQCK